MFNSTKTTDIKDDAEQLASTAKAAVSDVAADAKDAAQQLGKKIQAKTDDAKSDAEALIASLRELLSEKPVETKASEIKARIADQYANWKETVQDEVSHAVNESQARSRRVLNEQPLLTLAVAIGAGAFIGYLIGNHQSQDQ